MKTVEILGLKLGPLKAPHLRDNKDRIKAALRLREDPNAMDALDFVDLTCDLTLLCAQRVNPQVTKQQVDELIDLENVQSFFAACWGASVPEPLPGEPVAASPST